MLGKRVTWPKQQQNKGRSKDSGKDNVKQKKEAKTVLAGLPLYQQKCALLAQEKGSSSWLGATPIERLGFTLYKGAFWDALCLRYCWDIQLAPPKCRCGAEFEMNHVLRCRQGGYHTIRHNELCDTLASLLRKVCQAFNH